MSALDHVRARARQLAAILVETAGAEQLALGTGAVSETLAELLDCEAISICIGAAVPRARAMGLTCETWLSAAAAGWDAAEIAAPHEHALSQLGAAVREVSAGGSSVDRLRELSASLFALADRVRAGQTADPAAIAKAALEAAKRGRQGARGRSGAWRAYRRENRDGAPCGKGEIECKLRQPRRRALGHLGARPARRHGARGDPATGSLLVAS